MDERESRRRENDSLQSGERDPAYGQDARDFGVGGQTIERALDQGDDEPRIASLAATGRCRRGSGTAGASHER